MSETFQMFVVFFFDNLNIANAFINCGDAELAKARKLIQAPFGAEITAEYIAEDTGIAAPVMLLYPLEEVEPIVLTADKIRVLDSAS